MERRDFIKLTALAVGGASLSGTRLSHSESAIGANEELQRWTKSLLDRGERRVYRGDELNHISFPLGGVGAGQVFLTGRGRLTQWQIVNNFNSRSNLPEGAFFGVRAKADGNQPVARLLQEGNLGNIPPVTEVEFSGEYPFAWIRYLDEMLPVDVTLEAYSPFVPLNTKDSGLPAVFFHFTVRNPTNKHVDASIMASMPNLIGWDGYSPLDDSSNSDFVGNFNIPKLLNSAVIAEMVTKEGTTQSLRDHRSLRTNDSRTAHLMQWCDNLKVFHGTPPSMSKTLSEAEGPDGDPSTSVFWIGDSDVQSIDRFLSDVLDAVQNGSSLVIAGENLHLLELAHAADAPQDVVIFENWESGNYANWKVTGDCFGDAPARGTLARQQQVSGWRGRYFVNTYVNGDETTGRATSREFTIEKRFIHLLVGGGNHPNATCVNLKVGAQVVATATGENTERLRPVRWDVSGHRGKKAVIEIVDTHTGGWGHILVDEIVFSDSATSPSIDPALARRLRDALPMSWTNGKAVGLDAPIQATKSRLNGIKPGDVHIRKLYQFDGLGLRTGGDVLLEAQIGAPLVIAGPHGRGRIIVCAGDPSTWMQGVDRKTIVGSLIADASQTAYKPQTGWSKSAPPFGTMSLGLLNVKRSDKHWSAELECNKHHFEGLWRDFEQDGYIGLTAPRDKVPLPENPNAALSRSVSLLPGQEKEITFVLAWHFPNRTRDRRYGWGPPPYQHDHRLGNQYNNWFKDATEVVAYVASQYERLERETKLFHETFYDSTLPRWFLDCITANLSLIRSPIMVWLEDGTFGGYEGADACCPMNCTHVYNYAMSTAFVFPELERNVRETDLKVQMHPSEHYIPHRTVLPLSLPRLQNEIGGPHHHALDGELGTILKTYREWRTCGDRKWLSELWPRVKLVMQHVLRDHDTDSDGVIKGEQPNTYDTHAFGSNTFVGTLYLAALRATEELASEMGDSGFANECRSRFEKGSAGYDRTCWNGEYYYNVYDAQGATPQTYNQANCWGPGCHSDQLLGQWWSCLLGLGYLLPTTRVRESLQAVFRHNWLPDMSNHVHNQRVFASGKEKGLLCCSWPRGGRPQSPILYCDEVWTGIEYHVAASLIYEGMIEQGLQIARGARDRYTGSQRNPWAEVECGHHYSRAMSSYSLLTAASGHDYHAGKKHLSFVPNILPENYKAFFSTENGWGSISQIRTEGRQRNLLDVKHGQVSVGRLSLSPQSMNGQNPKVSIRVAGRSRKAVVQSDENGCHITFAQPVRLRAGQSMEVVIS